MRKRLWTYVIKKLENPLKAISVAVTILVIFNFTIDAVIASSKIIVDLNETKTITIRNITSTEDSRTTPSPRQPREDDGRVEDGDKTIEEKIRETFGEEGDRAIAVAKCESSLNYKAIGDTHLSQSSYGLFQISKIYHNHTEEDLLNEDYNIKVAHEIFDKGGWGRWTCGRNLGFNK